MVYFMLHRMGMKGELSERAGWLEGVYHPFDAPVETAIIFRWLSSARPDIVRDSLPYLFLSAYSSVRDSSPAFNLMRGPREREIQFRMDLYYIDDRQSRLRLRLPRDHLLQMSRHIPIRRGISLIFH